MTAIISEAHQYTLAAWIFNINLELSDDPEQALCIGGAVLPLQALADLLDATALVLGVRHG